MLECHLLMLLTAVFFFSPIAWLAAVLSKRDCEMACDERTINRMGIAKEEYGKKERSFYWKKLTRLFEPESEIIDKQNVRCRKKQELRKKFLELTERIPVIPNTHAKLPAKGLNTKEFPEVWQDNAENTDKQKFLLFNYLTAQGISPEEARVQIENLLFENTQNNTLNE